MHLSHTLRILTKISAKHLLITYDVLNTSHRLPQCSQQLRERGTTATFILQAALLRISDLSSLPQATELVHGWLVPRQVPGT